MQQESNDVTKSDAKACDDGEQMQRCLRQIFQAEGNLQEARGLLQTLLGYKVSPRPPVRALPPLSRAESPRSQALDGTTTLSHAANIDHFNKAEQQPGVPEGSYSPPHPKTRPPPMHALDEMESDFQRKRFTLDGKRKPEIKEAASASVRVEQDNQDKVDAVPESTKSESQQESSKTRKLAAMWEELGNMPGVGQGYIDQVMIAHKKSKLRQLGVSPTAEISFEATRSESSIQESVPEPPSTPASRGPLLDIPSEHSRKKKERAVSMHSISKRCSWIKIPVIDPQAKERIVWVFFGVFFIMYECVSVPILLCFDEDPTGVFEVIANTVTIYFLCDVLVSFVTGFQDLSGDVVHEPYRIVARYLRTWFLPDLLASVPLEWVVPNGGKSLRLMRFFRLLRLGRLIRIFKLKSIMNSVEAMMEGNTLFRFASRLCKLLGFLAMAMHWCACLWYFVGAQKSLHLASERTWVEIYLEDNNYHYIDQKYVWSLYFTLTTMTTVGYGDISPQTYAEAKFALFLLPVASVIFATLMGSLTDLIQGMNEAAKTRSERRMKLAHYLNYRDVPRWLRVRIRAYMIFSWESKQDMAEDEEYYKHTLSPILKENLCMHIHGPILTGLPFLAWMQGFPVCYRLLATEMYRRDLDRGDYLFQVGEQCIEISVLTAGTMWLSLNRDLHAGEEDYFETKRKRNPARVVPEDRAAVEAPTSPDAPAKRNSKGKESSGEQNWMSMNLATLKKRPPKNVDQQGEQSASYNIFDGDVFNDAYAQLMLHDLRVKHIVLRLQQNWRARAAQRQRKTMSSDTPVLDQNTRGMHMKSHRVHAPSYFGESCLWVPYDDWKDETTSHMYNARCELRGELVCIPRKSIAKVLERFSPWLPERFEYFRDSVVTALKATMDEAAAAAGQHSPKVTRAISKGTCRLQKEVENDLEVSSPDAKPARKQEPLVSKSKGAGGGNMLSRNCRPSEIA